jgi:hypothetical protein
MSDAANRPAAEKLGTFPFVVGGMSFIPLIGVVIGVAVVVWGLVTKKTGGKRLAAVGMGGIAFTVLLYGSLFYFGFSQRGGVADDQRTELARISMASLIPQIEFYKLQTGKCPESLEVLRKSLPKESFVSVFDPSFVELGSPQRYFFYERVGEDHYYLRGLGADGRAFTADDVLPQISSLPGAKLGLLLERKADS